MYFKIEDYGFYSKLDPKEEIIFKINSHTKWDAIVAFAIAKNLTTEQFLEIYAVKRI